MQSPQAHTILPCCSDDDSDCWEPCVVDEIVAAALSDSDDEGLDEEFGLLPQKKPPLKSNDTHVALWPQVSAAVSVDLNLIWELWKDILWFLMSWLSGSNQTRWVDGEDARPNSSLELTKTASTAEEEDVPELDMTETERSSGEDFV